MNPHTGHLVDLERTTVGPDYPRLPKRLQPEASQVLNGAPEAYVDLTANSRLAHWAAKKRKAKAKRKIATASKKRNRK